MPKKSQIDKFKEAARELDTSEDEAKFDAALRKVATAIGQDDPNADFGTEAWEKRQKKKRD